ncbi:hypothetical protein VAE151_600004 [Vibrio aestuarianus]|uniref:Uncharacterized protein n=1 Tax=Vibrio aestuarianus TaxID=28171 RepID=A0ABM9FV00_9VIBR|nr:hypothetical protein VAE308_1110006 [Vibrio aestuarianus]CAH8217524.1 hypothetical protein VAE055_410010 [Vibrio aestuarianus]CAH8217719.1 hypothetical protein VAE032_310010 [Vibrio aestuarianus]CAH8217826.1 hypothetical protein VAE128_490010 [Vibrio aestuarianus]CAH8218005.1 hypothetical protein VAE130_590010 [Vibrio aestuarianus]
MLYGAMQRLGQCVVHHLIGRYNYFFSTSLGELDCTKVHLKFGLIISLLQASLIECFWRWQLT